MVSKKEILLLFSLTGLLCILNATIDIMDIDAAQYAQISLELLHSKNWLQLFCLNVDYLDKPPLLFWMSALSFKVFGVHNWSYKLPSILFAVLGVYSTFRLTELMINKKAGYYAAIILSTSFAFFQLTHDIRTDTMLMGAVIFSAWQLYAFLLNNKISNIILASLGISLALMSKGPIGLIIPVVFFFLGTIFYQKKFSALLSSKLLLIPILVAIMLFPMCIGLYQQYGWHGINFFFWYQSFGRITGENTWKNNPDPLFLVHTTLWAFLPWTLLFIYSIIRELKKLVTFNSAIPGISLAFLLTLIALSLSKYQLPHYIFVAYPFLAIICAAYADDFFNSKLKYLQGALMICCVLLCVFVNFYCFPSPYYIVLLLLIAMALISFFMTHKLMATAIPITFLLISLSIGFQKELLKYQSFNEVGRFLKDKKSNENEIVNFNCKFSFAFSYYAQNNNQFLTTIPELLALKKQKKELWVYTSLYGYEQINKSEMANNTTLILTKESFEITRLKPAFLLPKSRADVIEKYYLLKII